MNSNVIITTIGPDQTGVVGRIINLVSEAGLNIVDSRLATFGGEFTLTLLLSGDLAAISRVELSMPQLGAELDLLTMLKRTSQHVTKEYPFKFHVEYSGLDSPGVLRKVTNYFADRNIELHSLRSSTEWDKEKKQEIMKSELEIAVTCNMDAISLKNDFTALCNEYNLHGEIQQIINPQEDE